MDNSILVQTIEALTPEERREIHHFLGCPLYNNGKHPGRIIAFFTLLDERISQKNRTKLEKEEICSALFGQDSYKSGYFENLMSELMDLIRLFIATKHATKSWGKDYISLAMAEFYRQRGHVDQARKSLGRIPSQGQAPENRRLMDYWAQKTRYKLALQDNRRKGDLNLNDALAALNLYHATELLELALMLRNQQIVDPELQSLWWNEIDAERASLKRLDYLGDPSCRVLDAAIDIWDITSEWAPPRKLARFQAVFDQNVEFITPFLQKMVAGVIRNYMITQYADFTDLHRFEVYQTHLSKGWLYENDQIQHTTFINMVNNSIKNGKVDWAETFIDEHKQRISGAQGHQYYLLGLATLYFHGRDWVRLDPLMTEMKTMDKLSDLGLEVMQRRLEIKIAYETYTSYEPLSALLAGYKKFIQRWKGRFSEAHLNMGVHFVELLNLLMRTRIDADVPKRRVEALKQAAEWANDPKFPLAERQWLKEKLAEFHAGIRRYLE